MDKQVLKVKYNKEKVLRVLNCHKNKAVYNQSMEILDQLVDDNLSKIRPIGMVKKVIGDKDVAGLQVVNKEMSEEIIACIVTLGPDADKAINWYFDEGMVYEGMLLSALCDQILFNCTKELHQILEIELVSSNLFLSRRHDPGSNSVPMENQKVLLTMMNELYGEDEVGITLSDGFMFEPSKTISYFYNITKQAEDRIMEHDCSLCEVVECPYRQVVIEVHKGKMIDRFKADNTDNLLEILRDHGVFVTSPCGGNKTCGKCKVKVIDNPFTYEALEADHLSQKEMEEGIVLACHHTLEEVESKLVIHFEDLNEESATGGILSDFKKIIIRKNKYESVKEQKYGVAVDIGTTTLVLSLVELNSGHVIQTMRRLNPQKNYGADVISRIMHVNENPNHKLGLVIRQALAEEITKLLDVDKNTHKKLSLEEITISGNTTMIYLLLDYNPEALAVSPFKTRPNHLITGSVDRLFRDCDLLKKNVNPTTKVTILPWISAYVGGDIVSGMYGTSLYDVKGNVMFVDIGTNGEMVFKTDKGIYAAATAAGPAFEGGNITCGIGNVKGAISDLHYKEDKFFVQTIENAHPVGICGSAIVDIVSILLSQGLVEDTGYMKEEVTITGDIKVYPKDIRQVQLAKAALMAGMQVLTKEAGKTMDEIDCLYIAGGFGRHLSIENGAVIGLIPKELVNRTEVVGNSSLAGAIRYLMEVNNKDDINKIKDHCHYIELSTHMEFNQLYVEEMRFKTRS